MPLRPELANLGRPPKILLLGSGGLSIGQAGEFDYSGTQAIRALRESGCEVIVVNPNIATVQTTPQSGVTIYLYPVEPHWVEKVIEKEKPDGIVGGFGGQTALNCLLALDDLGVLAKHHVLNLGTPPATLKMTEDRDLFAQKMQEINMPIPKSFPAVTVREACASAQIIGYPVIVRAAYALGGLGSGFATREEELVPLVEAALASAPQVLVEKSLKGWKEVEYEVMRDAEGNTMTICNMENFDPLGIHTGDSIVVCPSQSLTDEEYQMLRNASIAIVSACGIVGECNVQFALSPHRLEFSVIEVNARLSRSSALASKASGYPIAYIAGKVVLGFHLLELKNPVTQVTCALFEPALDYVTVKIPRWDLVKFRGVSRLLGSTMKSVGEVMGIGRSFHEAVQKAIRMVTENDQGLGYPFYVPTNNGAGIEADLREPTDLRFFVVMEALRSGLSVDHIHSCTYIDKWFLTKLHDLVEVEKEIRASTHLFDELQPKTLKRWKEFGFSDEQIARLWLTSRADKSSDIAPGKVRELSLKVRKLREALGVRPYLKKIDTTAAEHPTPSNYLYMTYVASFDDPFAKRGDKKTAVVLGSGSYRVGTSVEFDWCAVSCSQRLRHHGWSSVLINCNPETVSTDYHCSDRLYFEELSLERVLDILERENPEGVVASMGGQLPNRLAPHLAHLGVKLLGHSAETVDQAENRRRFSQLLDELTIDQPRWIEARSPQEIKDFVALVGFPILVRPSYVLSGAAMNVAYDDTSLQYFLNLAQTVSSEYPVVLSEFILGAREIELDGIAKNGEILTSIVSEHIENAGVHSGDATMVVPAQKLYVETIRRVRRAGRAIAKGLKLNGPFNIQFLARSNHIKVIECNARAARSFPFVSKVVRCNLAEAATDVMIGATPNLRRINEDELPYVGVKAALFSFPRLAGADPVLGVEMASTGEVGCIGEEFEPAFLLAMEAAKTFAPKRGVLISAGPEDGKHKFLPAARLLVDLGIKVYATRGTAKFFAEHGISVEAVKWPGEGSPDALSIIQEKAVDLVINIPKNFQRQEITYGSQIRQAAARFGCSLITNSEKAVAFVTALAYCEPFVSRHQVEALPPTT